MNNDMCLVEVHVIKKTENGIKYLLVKRSDDEKYPKIWQMITGHIEPGETAVEAAIRETLEEAGANSDNLWSIPHVNSYYNPEQDKICTIPVFVTEVDESFSPKISAEHSEFRWVNKDEAVNLVAWPGQKKSIEIIDEYFSDKLSQLIFLKVM